VVYRDTIISQITIKDTVFVETPVITIRDTVFIENPTFITIRDTVYIQGGSGSQNPSVGEITSYESLIGKRIIGSDEAFLGIISKGKFEQDSIVNTFGDHGSEFSAVSITNKFSPYGSQFSNLSALNPSASLPPKIFDGETFIAYLTTNNLLTPRVDMQKLLAWLNQG
jgi:hypothetical protein